MPELCQRKVAARSVHRRVVRREPTDTAWRTNVTQPGSTVCQPESEVSRLEVDDAALESDPSRWGAELSRLRTLVSGLGSMEAA